MSTSLPGCYVDASICIFRAEQESYGSAGLMLHVPRPRRHLGILQKGHHASNNSVLSSRRYRMLPQLWGGSYGVASWLLDVGRYFNGLSFPCCSGCVLCQVAVESGRIPRVLFC